MHTHHIVPKHMGGSDDPSNLVELTVAEHAEAHRVLWEEHGKIQDFCAWKGLLGEVGKEEIINQLRGLGGKKALENGNHNFFGGEIQSRTQRRLVESGKHWTLNSERVSEVRREMVENGTHNFVTNHPQKQIWECAVTGVVSTKAGFTRKARNKGLESWPHPLKKMVSF